MRGFFHNSACELHRIWAIADPFEIMMIIDADAFP
jgi:hypothetical protein